MLTEVHAHPYADVDALAAKVRSRLGSARRRPCTTSSTPSPTQPSSAGLSRPAHPLSSLAWAKRAPDTWRDPRWFALVRAGPRWFALKLYTSEGNFDLVGNNTPIFFIRDPITFPHFIRSQKRLPGCGLRSNHMPWDFWTLNPEWAHQVTYLMGERDSPKTWRQMSGYGSHTYMWIKETGVKSSVKYHFHADQGVEDLVGAEANRNAGEDVDFHRSEVLLRAFDYWKSAAGDTGKQIEEKVRAGNGAGEPCRRARPGLMRQHRSSRPTRMPADFSGPCHLARPHAVCRARTRGRGIRASGLKVQPYEQGQVPRLA